jgi:acyl carrier protein
VDKLISELKEIFEVSELPLDCRFESLSDWDSLNALSVIALLDEQYGIQMDAESLGRYTSILEFIQNVIDHKK